MNDWLPGLLKALRSGYEGYAGAQQYNVEQQQYEEEQHRKVLLDMMRQQQYEQQFGLSQEKHAETVRHHGVMEQPEAEEPPTPQSESQVRGGILEAAMRGEIPMEHPMLQRLWPEKTVAAPKTKPYPTGDRAKVSGYIAKGVHQRKADISEAETFEARAEEPQPISIAPVTQAFIDTLRQEAMRIFQPRYPAPEGGTDYNFPMPSGGAPQADSAAMLLELLGGGGKDDISKMSNKELMRLAGYPK